MVCGPSFASGAAAVVCGAGAVVAVAWQPLAKTLASSAPAASRKSLVLVIGRRGYRLPPLKCKHLKQFHAAGPARSPASSSPNTARASASVGAGSCIPSAGWWTASVAC